MTPAEWWELYNYHEKPAVDQVKSKEERNRELSNLLKKWKAEEQANK